MSEAATVGDYLILKTYALDEWDEALDAYAGPDSSALWESDCLKMAERGLLEQLIISNGSWWPPLKTYRLTEKGWALADATFWKLACVWCRGTKYTETGVLCRSCEGSGLARGTSSCAHKSPACDECVAHDMLYAMSS